MDESKKLSTGEVRRHYADYPGRFNERAREFDRWLAEHDAQVLRDAADGFERNEDGEWGEWVDYEGWSRDPVEVLRARADRIAAGGES